MNGWKIFDSVILSLILLGGGIAIGWFIKPEREVVKKETVYLPGDTVRTEKEKLVPYEVVVPVDTVDFLKTIVASGLYGELFPEKRDTVILEKEDSAAIMKDWMARRRYSETLFQSDTLGTCSVQLDVQYNRLYDLQCTYVPKTKVTTDVVTLKKKFSPFVGVGMTSSPSVVGQIGAFFNEKYGVSFQYQYDTNLKRHLYGGVVLYKF